jgi:hypothetical protein
MKVEKLGMGDRQLDDQGDQHPRIYKVHSARAKVTNWVRARYAPTWAVIHGSTRARVFTRAKPGCAPLVPRSRDKQFDSSVGPVSEF